MPTISWIINWHWSLNNNEIILKMLYYITLTIELPWGIFITIFLNSLFLWYLQFNKKNSLKLIILICTIILIGQGIKSFIKIYIKEPRPFTVLFKKNNNFNNKYFYFLYIKNNNLFIKNIFTNKKLIPNWLYKYWKYENNSSFPSGHTLFAVTWALLGSGLLWSNHHYKTVISLMLWALIIMESRLILGMHWPKDLLVSILISWFLVIIMYWLAHIWFKLLILLK